MKQGIVNKMEYIIIWIVRYITNSFKFFTWLFNI